MADLGQYFDDPREDPSPVLGTDEEDDDVLGPEGVAEKLQGDPELVNRVLRMLDGFEDFPTMPRFEEPEAMLDGLGTETFQDTLSRVWEAIKRWLRALRKYIADETRWVALGARTTRFQAENVKINARGNRSRSKGPLTLRSHITALSVFYNPPKDIGSMIAGLRRFDNVLDGQYGYISRLLVPRAERLGTRIQRINVASFSPTDIEDIEAEARRLSPFGQVTPLGLNALNGNPTELAGYHLMGNQRLMLSLPVQYPTTLPELNRIRLRLRHSEISPRPMPESVEIPRFTMIASDQALDQVIMICKKIEEHAGKANRIQRNRLVDSLEKQGADLARRIENSFEDLHGRKEQLRQLLYLMQSLADWTMNPDHGLTASALRSSRGVLMVCRANQS